MNSISDTDSEPRSRIFDLINVDMDSSLPKYLQLSNSIIDAIHKGRIREGDLLPSINELIREYHLSKATAEKGYKILRDLGVVNAVHGKCFYVADAGLHTPHRVMLLFNSLSVHRKMVYDAFMDRIGQSALVDFYVYNNDFRLFKRLLSRRLHQYSHYVVMPHFLDNEQLAADVLNQISPGKLILVDKLMAGLHTPVSVIYEDFERDILGALTEALPVLEKYRSIKVVFPSGSYHSTAILSGVSAFCQAYAFPFEMVNSLTSGRLHEGDVIICLKEEDLVSAVQLSLSMNLKVGQQVGIISYNETPLKKIILNGITTISTDFEAMGAAAADFILNGRKGRVKLPFTLRLRASL